MVREQLGIRKTVPALISVLPDEHRKNLRVKPVYYPVAFVSAFPAVFRAQRYMHAFLVFHLSFDILKTIVHDGTALKCVTIMFPKY